MSIPRSKHTATLLPDGKVLLVGGKNADLFDPATQTYTPTIGTTTNRKSHAALLLPNGTVLITGGYVGKLAATSAEIYNPATQSFTATAHSDGHSACEPCHDPDGRRKGAHYRRLFGHESTR